MTKPAKIDVSTMPLLSYDYVRERHDTEAGRVLWRMLTTKRPHGGVGEARLCSWLVQTYGSSMIDAAGNLHFDLRTSTEHKTLFTAHIDTVHRKDGHNVVRVDGKNWRADGDCLGADDGAGVALLCHMMHHRVPGYYIIFRGEECGGVGSSWLAENMPELLREFDRAVAFDRAGYSDVITHQGGRRCASDEFANALASALTPEDFSMTYVPDSGGVYTDTAEFVGIIPECTNVSVGYFSQHGDREYQDVEFLEKLAAQLLMVQWDSLPTSRNPATYESLYDNYAKGLTATRLSAFDQSYDFELCGPELDLETALIYASEHLNLNTRWLVDMVSELINPDDPGSVRMNTSRLDEEVISYALDMLYEGFSAEDVAVEIYDALRLH